MRWLVLLSLLAMPLSAQTPDSVQNFQSMHQDSTRLYFTRVRVDTVIGSLPSPALSGIPFGPIQLLSNAEYRWGKSYGGVFSLHDGNTPNPIGPLIAFARAHRMKLFLNMTGGSHSKYITNGKFDLGKWKVVQKAYDTPANRIAMAEGVADGTVLGADMVDEANHPTWGGWFTKARLDTMALYVKSIFPTLPTGLIIQYDWRPTELYKVVDFTISQYSARKGDLVTYRAGVVAMAKANGIRVALSMNVIDWYANTGTCPVPLTGGPGSEGGDFGQKGCRITPLDLEQAGLSLGLTPEVCALTMWTNDSLMFENPAYREPLARVRAALDARPFQGCRR